MFDPVVNWKYVPWYRSYRIKLSRLKTTSRNEWCGALATRYDPGTMRFQRLDSGIQWRSYTFILALTCNTVGKHNTGNACAAVNFAP
jgi:hypothetical protein